MKGIADRVFGSDITENAFEIFPGVTHDFFHTYLVGVVCLTKLSENMLPRWVATFL